eukprot:gene17284-20570_t
MPAMLAVALAMGTLITQNHKAVWPCDRGYLVSEAMVDKRERDEARGDSIPLLLTLAERDAFHVRSTGALATIHYAIGLLNQYCSTLPTDEYIMQRRPHFLLPRERCMASAPQVCTVSIPGHAWLPKLRGEPKARQREAKASAALEAIRWLHQHHELDDHFRPVRPKRQKRHHPEAMIADNESDDGEGSGECGAGDGMEMRATSKHFSSCTKRPDCMPPIFQIGKLGMACSEPGDAMDVDPMATTLHLHSLTSPRPAAGNVTSPVQTFGLLAANRLHRVPAVRLYVVDPTLQMSAVRLYVVDPTLQVPPVRLYIGKNKCTLKHVKMEYVGAVLLEGSDLEALLHFHRWIDRTLVLPCPDGADAPIRYLLAPLVQRSEPKPQPLVSKLAARSWALDWSAIRHPGMPWTGTFSATASQADVDPANPPCSEAALEVTNDEAVTVDCLVQSLCINHWHVMRC